MSADAHGRPPCRPDLGAPSAGIRACPPTSAGLGPATGTPGQIGWRSSVLLVAGDNAGQWNAWYAEAIPLAEQRYKTYLVERGGEDAVAAGRQELLAVAVGHRLAEVRRERGLTQAQVAERMGVTKGRISQIEQGSLSGQDAVARYAAALGGRLHQAIYFDDGDIAAIA